MRREIKEAKEMAEAPGKKKRKMVGEPIPLGKFAAAHIDEDWILTKVIAYVKRRRVYKVEDVDEDEDGKQLQYESALQKYMRAAVR